MYLTSNLVVWFGFRSADSSSNGSDTFATHVSTTSRSADDHGSDCVSLWQLSTSRFACAYRFHNDNDDCRTNDNDDCRANDNDEHNNDEHNSS